MKIIIQEDSGVPETEILIKCQTADAEIEEILACLSLAGDTVTGKSDGHTHLVPLIDILYFESVDNKIFFYLKIPYMNRRYGCTSLRKS